MNRNRIAALTPLQLTIFSIALSLASSLAVYLLRERIGSRASSNRASYPGGSARPNPVTKPSAIEPSIAEVPPPHFTEEMIIPGFTETGEQIVNDDDAGRRSEGGV